MHALILTTVLVAAPLLSGTEAQSTALTLSAIRGPQDPAVDPKADFDRRKKEAEGSVEKLWRLYDWCESNSLKNESRSTLRAIIKLEPDNSGAHKLLGHVEYEGKWFDTEKKLEEFKKKELEKQAKATGKVVYKGALVDPADIARLEKGLTKDASGKWVDADEQKKIAEGWVRQDLNWIPPAEIENIAKGLWKCGDKWLSLEAANKHHSEVGRWWIVANERFIVYSTCPRDVVEQALEQCEKAQRDLIRAYGKTPAQAVPVIVLNSLDQYTLFARGEAGNTHPDPLGRSSTHGAFMAESYVDFLSTGQTLPGVAYWDFASKTGALWGPILARHAAGQSYAEALDQSPKAIAKLLKGEDRQVYGASFWAEKQVPQWFRYGAAAYVSRYAPNPLAAAGADPFENRTWSVSNIAGRGGLDPLDRIFKFEIGPDNKDSDKLINESGLLLAFALDGNCVDVQAKHAALKEAIKDNKEISKAAQALADEIKKNEAKLRTFAAL